MKEVANELIGLGEKILDPNFKGENLDILGFVVPSSLEEVGLVGATASIAKLAKVISDHFFAKNFEKFTNELGYITPEQKIKFYEKYPKKKIQDFGEQAILLLNKIEMPLAAKMIGKAHYLLVLGEIDESTYFNYCHIAKNINYYIYENLLKVYQHSEPQIFTGGVFSLMESLGLMFEIQEGLYASDVPDENNPQIKLIRYMRSEFGKEFYHRIIEALI